MEELVQVRLARMEEKQDSMKEWAEAHEKKDDDYFGKTFKYMKERFDKVDTKLETLWDGKNRSEGAFSVGRLMAGGIGGILVAIIDYAVRGH